MDWSQQVTQAGAGPLPPTGTCPTRKLETNRNLTPEATMAKKSDRTLRQRFAKLNERGIDVMGGATIADIVDVVGDLTVSELERMLLVERQERYVNGIRAS